jgi:outer membrane protein OmpA-like peptidoglycan-associated protein
MKKALAILGFLTLCESPLLAQDLTDTTVAAHTQARVNDSVAMKSRFGVYLNYGWNLAMPDFSILPGAYSCCHKYSEGDGKGISFGALYEMPIYRDWYLSFRAGFNQLDQLLTNRENTNVIINGVSQNGVFEHRLNTKLGMLNFDLGANYRAFENLFVNLGFKFGYFISSSYQQLEKIVEPNGVGVFEDSGLPIRNYSEGDLKDLNNMQAFINAGVSYELPLNKKNFLFIVPEINFSYGLTNVVSGIAWNDALIKGGFAVKYQEPPTPPPPPEPPLFPPSPEFPEPAPAPTIYASLKAEILDSNNNRSDSVRLLIEDFISFNMRPMLNYIFFDENSSEIPKRYIKIKSEETDSFKEDELKNMDVLPTYYYVLNIIGKRLRETPRAKITLVGANSNEGVEEGNLQLSQRRAESVKAYFTDVWGIDAGRIKVEARNLPKEFSNYEEVGGNEENRRVEIIASDPDISEPVFTIDTIRRISKASLRFYPKIDAQAGIKNWKLSAKQDNSEIFTDEGNTEYPDTIDWTIDEDKKNNPRKGGQVDYSLDVTDNLGQSFSTPIASFPIDQLSIDKKKVEGIADKEFEFYSLILFDYGKSKLGSEHKKTAALVKKRITKESKVSIIGYTDAMGGEEINKKISYERANEFAKKINLKNSKILGAGESELLYDNSLPEGRFYCRTVKITIETPINNEK